MSTKNRKKALRLAAVLLALLIPLLWKFADTHFGTNNTSSPAALTGDGDAVLTAQFLDVGQGDCTLFFLPDGKTLLIDAGNRPDGDDIVRYLKGQSVKKIDYLVATHPHADHIGGMPEVIDSMEIGQVFAPRIAAEDIPTTKTYEAFLTSVKNKGLKLTAAKQGDALFVGEGYRVDCLSPCGSNYGEMNLYSVVVKLTFGAHAFLLTGDAEATNEAEMLKAGADLSCDVLKVGHHGSSSSTTAAFLKAAKPTYAVISCGRDNSYGHPHRETINALQSAKGLKKIFRTDLDQTIIMTSNGKNPITYSVGHPSVVS